MKGTHMSIKDIILPRIYRQLFVNYNPKGRLKKKAKRKRLEITETKTNKISDLFLQLWLCSADL